MPHNIAKLRDDVVQCAIQMVEESGAWSWPVITRAMEKCVIQDKLKESLFPNGIIDAVAHFSDMVDRQMMAKLSKVPVYGLRSKDKIRLAILTRYNIMNNCKNATKQAMAFWAVPTHVIQGQRVVWRTADSIWNWAGDTATDYNRQTKRALLTSILVGTTMVWLTDESDDQIITQAFLDRRLENVMAFGNTMGTIKKIIPNLFRQVQK